MTPLRQRFIEDMQVRNLAETTQTVYVNLVAAYAKHFRKSPELLGPEDMRSYLVYLTTCRSKNTAHCANAALRFLYRYTLEKDWKILRDPFPKRESKLPVVLSVEEVAKFFDALQNTKYRAILMTIYAAGLRASEVVSLKVGDIDSGRMQIKVSHGKGGKDRYVMLSPVLLTILREYWRIEQPGRDWLFPGLPPTKAISTRAALKACQDAAATCLKKHITLHTLRHSFATHLLENGSGIRLVQLLLGHRSLSTTARYLHISQQTINATPSPLDGLPAVATDDALGLDLRSGSIKRRSLTFEERLAKNAAEYSLEATTATKTAS